MYIHEAEHLVVDSNFDSFYDKDYIQVYSEPAFDALDRLSTTVSKIRDIKVNKIEGEFEHCVVRDNVLFFIDRVPAEGTNYDYQTGFDGDYISQKHLVYYPPEKQDKSFIVKADEDLYFIKEGTADILDHLDEYQKIQFVDRTNIMQVNKYLEEINVEDGNEYRYYSIDGVVYRHRNKEQMDENDLEGLVFCPSRRKKALNIPEGI